MLNFDTKYLHKKISMDILDVIKQRKSTRDFADKPVDEELVLQLFEAARWAPSAFNFQPWSFIYATKDKNPELYEKLFGLLFEFNKAWAKSSPVLILCMSSVKSEVAGEDYRHAWHDVGLATGNMQILATSIGLSLHIMSGFSIEKAKSELNIPEKIEPVSMIALGYPTKSGNLPLDIYKMESSQRERKKLEEFVFNKEFGTEDTSD